MTNAEMLNLVMSRISRSAAATRALVLKELNEKIRQFEQADVLPWFLKDVWTPTATASVDYIDLPSDYLRDDDDGDPEIKDISTTPNTWKEFVKVPYNRLRRETANADAALPQGFAVYGEKLYFGPIPDLAYPIRLPYFKRSSEVLDDNSAITNKWLLNFFNFVTLDTIDLVCRTHTRDTELMQRIAGELQQAQDAFWRAVEAREHAGQNYLLDNEEK